MPSVTHPLASVYVDEYCAPVACRWDKMASLTHPWAFTAKCQISFVNNFPQAHLTHRTCMSVTSVTFAFSVSLLYTCICPVVYSTLSCVLHHAVLCFVALFSSILLDTVSTESLQSWTACNRGCFVLVRYFLISHFADVSEMTCSLSTVPIFPIFL